MKKRILIVLPLLLFGLMVAGCEKDIAEENNLNEVRNKELSDLVEYKNKQWGFKILYPEGWEYEENISSSIGYVVFSPIDKNTDDEIVIEMKKDSRKIEEIVESYSNNYTKKDSDTYLIKNDPVDNQDTFSSNIIKKNDANFFKIRLVGNINAKNGLTPDLYDKCIDSFSLFESDPIEINFNLDKQELEITTQDWHTYSDNVMSLKYPDSLRLKSESNTSIRFESTEGEQESDIGPFVDKILLIERVDESLAGLIERKKKEIPDDTRSSVNAREIKIDGNKAIYLDNYEDISGFNRTNVFLEKKDIVYHISAVGYFQNRADSIEFTENTLSVLVQTIKFH